MDPPILDEKKLEMLLELDDGRAGLLGEMVALFAREAPRRLGTIENAIRDGNPKAAMEAAHGLKGASGLLGAEQVFSQARAMEVNGKEGQVPSQASLDALQIAVQGALKALDDFLTRFIAPS